MYDILIKNGQIVDGTGNPFPFPLPCYSFVRLAQFSRPLFVASSNCKLLPVIL